MLPVVLSESYVIFERRNEEVAVGDRIKDGESCGMTKCISVGWEFSALEEDSLCVGVLSFNFQSFGNDAGLDFHCVDFTTDSNCFEAINIFAAYDNESFILGVNATFISNQIAHRFEGLAIGSHYNDLLVLCEGASDGGKLSQSRHEDGLFGVRTSQLLVPHHESTVTCDSGYFLLVNKIVNRVAEGLLYFRCELSTHAHAKCEAGHNLVVHVIAVRFSAINVTRCWRIVVIQPDYAE